MLSEQRKILMELCMVIGFGTWKNLLTFENIGECVLIIATCSGLKASDYDAQNSRTAFHHIQFVFVTKLLLYTNYLRHSLHALTVVPRLTQPSPLCMWLNEHQNR